MSKKVWIGVTVVVLATVGVFLAIALHGNGAKALESGGKPIDDIRTKQALALPKTESCLTNVPKVKAAAEKQQGLSEETGVWTGEILDVPAGTQVQVNVASYHIDTVTGSLLYPPKYGSYNFTLHKQPGGWYFTRFTGCH